MTPALYPCNVQPQLVDYGEKTTVALEVSLIVLIHLYISIASILPTETRQ